MYFILLCLALLHIAMIAFALFRIAILFVLRDSHILRLFVGKTVVLRYRKNDEGALEKPSTGRSVLQVKNGLSKNQMAGIMKIEIVRRSVK